MVKCFCPYCGLALDKECECEKFVAEEREQFLERYYDSPETQAGWRNEDEIYNSRRER